MAEKAYSRNELRGLQRTWLRANARMVCIFVAGALALLAFTTMMLLRIPDTAPRWYLLGFVHAAAVSAVLAGLNMAFLTQSKDAIRHVRGSWGEENTRSELKKAKRRRITWGSVEALPLRFGDLDHVVVTRRGGVVVIDSKWRNEITTADRERMTRSAIRAQTRLTGLVNTVYRPQPGVRHRARGSAVAVTTAVVLWGTARSEVPDGAVFDGVTFLDGRNLIRWLKNLEGCDVSRAAGRQLIRELEKQRVAT